MRLVLPRLLVFIFAMDHPARKVIGRVENFLQQAKRRIRGSIHNIGAQQIPYRNLDYTRQEIRVFVLSSAQDDESPIEGQLESIYLSGVPIPSALI